MTSREARGQSRARVLGALQDARQPLDVGTVAERVGLHANTARFHLDALVDAGLADRSAEGREQPGRPRFLYAARPGSAHAGQRNYRFLAEILTGFVAAESARPAETGLRAGEAWGRHLADRPPPFRRTEPGAAVAQLVDVLDDIGFAPQAGPDRQIRLHHCPFRELAETHRDLVCSVHLGLMRGLLAELDTPVGVERLDPFVTAHLCVTHLTGPQDGTLRPAEPGTIGPGGGAGEAAYGGQRPPPATGEGEIGG